MRRNHNIDLHAIKIERKNNALRNVLRYARQHSPWYQKILKNIPIETMCYEHLSDLPTMTKQTLMEHWDDIVTDRALNLNKVINHLDKMNDTDEIVPLDEKYIVFSTGGSSGKKGILIYDIEKYKKAVVFADRRFKKNISRFVTLKKNEQLITAQVIVTNAVYMMHARLKIYKPEDEIRYHFPITQPLSEIVTGLNKVQPHRLIALPSTIHYLCNKAKSGSLTINPSIITVASEPLYQPIKQLIYDTWPKANLFNIYGASEGLAAQTCLCNSNYMHLYDDWSMITPVNQYNQVVERDAYSDKLIFTNLSNYILPLINYEIEDRLRFMSKACPCGSPYPLIEEPKGRPANDFIYPGNILIHHLIFVTPLLTDGHVVEYQVIQTHQGAKIKIVSDGPVKTNKIINTICQDYSKLGMDNAQIEIIDVSQLEYLPSGKMRRFLAL